MITLRRARDRYDDRRGKQQAWLTFYVQAADDLLAEGFGGLTQLDEIRLPPGGSIKAQAQREVELITYVLDGTLACEDSLGPAGLMQAGEFRCVTIGPGVRASKANLSRSHWTHLFQIGLRSDAGLQRLYDQKRFSAAQRRDGLCLIASAAARAGSLRLREDGLVYSALLRSGQHLVHDLRENRRAWLHVVKGEIALRDLVLTSGDGVGINGARAVSFTAVVESEVLLVDVI